MLKLQHLWIFALTIVSMAGFSHAASGSMDEETATREGYANPELLLSTEWLAKHGSEPGVVTVDARNPADYGKGHIPGAIQISISETYNPDERGQMGTAKQIAALLGARGIKPSAHVVIYDSGRSWVGARMFWILEVSGHAKVSVLDGGIAKWKHESRKLSTSITKLSAVSYKPGKTQPGCSGIDQILEDVEDPQAVMLDARSKREFDAGRIPEAIRIEWTANFTTGSPPVLKSAKELLSLYADQGVTPDKRVHAY